MKTECLMTTPQPGITPTEWLQIELCSISSFKEMFSNLVKLSAIPLSLPEINSWPERGTSASKRVKARLCNSLKDSMLDSLAFVAVVKFNDDNWFQ